MQLSGGSVCLNGTHQLVNQSLSPPLCNVLTDILAKSSTGFRLSSNLGKGSKGKEGKQQDGIITAFLKPSRFEVFCIGIWHRTSSTRQCQKIMRLLRQNGNFQGGQVWRSVQYTWVRARICLMEGCIQRKKTSERKTRGSLSEACCSA
jgi:hypothetical protein